MKDMERLPWAKWSYDDFANDPGIRASSDAAVGIWMFVLAALNRSEERGYLILAGKPPSDAMIARMISRDRRAVKRCLAELERNNVFSRDERGAIYCRRMVREDLARRNAVVWGQQGGNPALRPEGKPEGKPVQSGDNPVQNGGKSAHNGGDLLQICPDEVNNNNGMEQKSLNPPLKPDSDSDSEKNRENPPSPDSLAPRAATPGALRVVPKVELFEGADVVPFVGSPTRTAFDLWNAMARRAKVKLARDFTDQRRKLIAARLKDCGGMAGWEEMLAQVERSDFLCGRIPGKPGKIGLDWVLKPVRFAQVRDGQCEEWFKGAAAAGGDTSRDWMASPRGEDPAEGAEDPDAFAGETIDGEAESA